MSKIVIFMFFNAAFTVPTSVGPETSIEMSPETLSNGRQKAHRCDSDAMHLFVRRYRAHLSRCVIARRPEQILLPHFHGDSFSAAATVDTRCDLQVKCFITAYTLHYYTYKAVKHY